MEKGFPYYTLSELMHDFCFQQFNDREKHYQNYLIHAKWIFKDLFKWSLYEIVSKMVKVDKTTFPYTIKIPRDSVRVFNVSVPDEDNRLRSLLPDGAMNIVKMPSASCDCNDPSLFNSLFSNITACTKDILIEGTTYTQTNYQQLCSNGEVYMVSIIPTQEYIGPSHWKITYVQSRSLITQLEVKPCGCIINNTANVTKLLFDCGCPVLPQCKTAQLLAKPYQKFGTMKIANGYVYLEGNIPDYVQLSWQTNGDSGEDAILVPEIAADVIFFGVNWRAKFFSGNIINQKIVDGAYRQYCRVKDEFDWFLNAINVEEWLNNQMVFAKWGNSGTGLDWKCLPTPVQAQLPACEPAPVKTETKVIYVDMEYDRFDFENQETVRIPWSGSMPVLTAFQINTDKSEVQINIPPYEYANNVITVYPTGVPKGYIQILKPVQQPTTSC